jgi:hypothetical protein
VHICRLEARLGQSTASRKSNRDTTHTRAFFAQFLESYKSVTLSAMASSFHVSPEFLDGELQELIVSGRIHAKVDRVAGVIEASR